MDLCLGEVGLERDMFLRMTWGNLWRTIYGYWIRQEREWDRTRTIVAMQYNTHRGRRQPHKPAHRLMPLAIDRMGRQTQEWTEEKYKYFEDAQEAWGLKQKDGTK